MYDDNAVLAYADCSSINDFESALKKYGITMATAYDTFDLYYNMNKRRPAMLKRADKIRDRKKAAEEYALHQISIKTAAMKKTTTPHAEKFDGDLEALLTKIYNQLLVLEQVLKDIHKNTEKVQ